MKRLILAWIMAAGAVLALPIGMVAGGDKQPLFVVDGPTVIAFFPPVTDAELKADPDTAEALADFQFYAAQIREPLNKAGVKFHEVYVHSFRVRDGKTLTTFRPRKTDVGYYLVSPGKKPHVEYGVMTDADLLQLAREYFHFGGK